MAYFALVVDGIVDNIIVADTLEIAKAVGAGATAVQYSYEDKKQPHIGLSWNNKDGFEQPEPIVMPAPEPIIPPEK